MKKKTIIRLFIILFCLAPISSKADTLYQSITCDGNSASVYGTAYAAIATTTIESISFNIQCTGAGANQTFPYSIVSGYYQTNTFTTIDASSTIVQCNDTNPFSSPLDVIDFDLSPGQTLYIVSDANSLANTCYTTTITADNVARAGGSLSSPNVSNSISTDGSHDIFGYIHPAESGGCTIADLSGITATSSELIEDFTQISYTYSSSAENPDSITISKYRVPSILLFFLCFVVLYVLLIFGMYININKRRK